jgi:3-hydroxy-9,10-secoandrosta-1,3,5(10)-triene-9,17-dione monooxygenase reductase component
MDMVNPEELRQAMRCWASGVAVVTVNHAGVRHGMTVTSFTSISLEPPMISISVQHTARTQRLILASGFFAVSFLSSDQQSIAERFAQAHTEFVDRLAGLETFILVSGAPLISGGLAFLDCQVFATHTFGGNMLLIGEIKATRLGSANQPLLYYDRQYRMLQE